MTKKPKRKIKLPTDRTGRPVQIDDVLEWDSGERQRVSVLNYYGNGWWTAEDVDANEFTDNIGSAVIVGHIGERGRHGR